MILLDTSVLSRAFRRVRRGPQEEQVRGTLDRLLTTRTPVAVPAIVLLEVLSGIRSDTQLLDLEQRLLGSFPVLHPATREYLDAARLRNRCLAKGFNVSGIDCLIAAMAMSGGHRLFAMDRDFETIASEEPLRLYRARSGKSEGNPPTS